MDHTRECPVAFHSQPSPFVNRTMDRQRVPEKREGQTHVRQPFEKGRKFIFILSFLSVRRCPTPTHFMIISIQWKTPSYKNFMTHYADLAERLVGDSVSRRWLTPGHKRINNPNRKALARTDCPTMPCIVILSKREPTIPMQLVMMAMAE